MKLDKICFIKRWSSQDELKDMYSLFYKEVENKGGDLSAGDKKFVDEMVFSVGESENNWGFFVNDYEQNPVGFVLCKRYTNAAASYIKSGDVEIESFVNLENRGRGLGTLLKKVAIDSVSEMKQGKPARVLSFVESNNSVNLSVLKKTGFSKIRNADYEGDFGRTYSVYVKRVA